MSAFLHDPEDDDVLSPAEADAIAAVFRRGEVKARRYSMTLEDHRRLNPARPVTDVLTERLASPGSVITPQSLPSESERKRLADRERYQQRRQIGDPS
jgi:hypothetical protein